MIEPFQIDDITYYHVTGQDAERAVERGARIARLQRTRGMTYRAAAVVIDRAMEYHVARIDEPGQTERPDTL